MIFILLMFCIALVLGGLLIANRAAQARLRDQQGRAEGHTAARGAPPDAPSIETIDRPLPTRQQPARNRQPRAKLVSWSIVRCDDADSRHPSLYDDPAEGGSSEV